MQNTATEPRAKINAVRPCDTYEHEARLVLARAGEDWGEAVFAIRIAPFARDVAAHLDEVTLDDLLALRALGRAAERESKKRKSRMITDERIPV